MPPGWVGWLHKRIEKPPSEQPLPVPKWEKEPPLPNLTGTDAAYLPPGAIAARRPARAGDRRLRGLAAGVGSQGRLARSRPCARDLGFA